MSLGAGARWRAAGEVVLFFSAAITLIWRSDIPTAVTACLIAFLVFLCVASSRWHHDGRARGGFDPAAFWPACRMSFTVALPLLVPLAIVAWTRRDSGMWQDTLTFAGYPIWGFLQEYAMLVFVANRLEDAFDGRTTLVPWITGALFATAHWPNPMLASVTFVAGVVFTIVFLRHRNIWPMAALHAAFGTCLQFAFGHIYGIMSVGPAYLRRIGEVQTWF